MQHEVDRAWRAGWIRFGWNPVVPLLRKDFELAKALRSGKVRSTALGVQLTIVVRAISRRTISNKLRQVKIVQNDQD